LAERSDAGRPPGVDHPGTCLNVGAGVLALSGTGPEEKWRLLSIAEQMLIEEERFCRPPTFTMWRLECRPIAPKLLGSMADALSGINSAQGLSPKSLCNVSHLSAPLILTSKNSCKRGSFGRYSKADLLDRRRKEGRKAGLSGPSERGSLRLRLEPKAH